MNDEEKPKKKILVLGDYGVGKKAPKTKKGKTAPTLFEQIQKSVFPGMQGGPHMNQIAALAVALKEANSSSFKK